MTDKELLLTAIEAREKAYAPYSNHKVGAALVGKSGKVYTGCNVENAAYTPTNCAERTAIFKAVSEGATEFTTIAIAATVSAPWPCGACRQVLNEFAPDIRVLVVWDGGEGEMSLRELLPHGFGPSDLV